jgi:hypothetical protein
MISDNTKTDIKKAATATKTAAQSVLRDGQTTAVDIAEQTATMAKDKAGEIAGTVKTKAMDAAAAVGDKADAATGAIAMEGHRLAKNLRAAASDRSETVQGRVLDVVAGGVESVSDTLGERTLGSIFTDVQGYARRNPGAFVAGAAVVGFALARFMRAGERRS